MRVSICSPSIELEGNFSLIEMFRFHYSLREIKNNISEDEFFEFCLLKDSRNKKVNELSSGMTQRLKLAFAFITKSDLILLDEPCMNLDQLGIDMYSSFITNFGSDTTQVVASNSVAVEYAHCTAEIIL